MSQQSEAQQELVLADLADDVLVEQVFDDLYDGLANEIAEATRILLGRGGDAKCVLDEALVGGMNIVGADFRDGTLFVPEVLLAANAMKAGMAILKPILAETGAEPIGKMVIGTVKPYMKVVIDTMKAQGLRDDYIVLVGGAPLNEEFSRAVGANAYCRDAATAVEVATRLIKERRAARA